LPFEADVIVAGAGPVGLVAALSLAVAGMRVLGLWCTEKPG
jgi:ribulose 1,5-bisphosphate synthetase/thiazole synthase